MPRISVLMSVYNGERFLEEAVESILTQTYKDFEFIIFDDGSVDETPSILKKYQKEDDRIRVITQHNIGLSNSMNKGIEIATGEYIARMDADDISLPQRFEKQVDFMDAHPDVGVCGSWIQFFVGPTEGDVIQYPSDQAVIRSKMFFQNPFPHPAVILRTSVFREHQELRYKVDYAHAEDYDLFSRCAGITGFANIPEVLLLYRIHPNQVSQAQHNISVSSQTKVHRRLVQDFISATEEEIAINNCLCIEWERKPDRKQIKAAENWLYKLHTTNRLLKYYPYPEFSNEIANVWLRLIWFTESDITYFWKIMASPYYPYLPLNWYEKRHYLKRSLTALIIKVRMFLTTLIKKLPYMEAAIIWIKARHNH